MSERTEFGATRSVCGCAACQTNCRHMPGYLIPADLDRMIPPDRDAFAWAEKNLLASPGALVLQNGELFRIPTLVPAVQRDGSCIHFQADGQCAIHAVSPFGCAFFSCQSGPEAERLSARGLAAIAQDRQQPGQYTLLWRYLWRRWKRQKSPNQLRQRMQP